MKFRKIISTLFLAALLAAASARTGFAQTYFPPTTIVNLTYVPVNLSFSNNGNSSQLFSVTFQTTPFSSPIDFSAGSVRASLGISLTDGTAGETGVTLSSLTETAQLSYVVANTTIASAPLTSATLSIGSSNAFAVPAGDGTDTETLRTTGYLSDPITGSFNVLTVTVSGQLPGNSTLGVTGRVDVQTPLEVTAVPEPSSIALMLIATLVFVSCLRRKLIL